MSGEDASAEINQAFVEYFKSLFMPTRGDAMTEKEPVLATWVEIISPAGRLISPESVLTIDKRLPESCLKTLVAMGTVSGAADVNGIRMSVSVRRDYRVPNKTHTCPVNDATDALDPWHWELAEPRESGAS